LVPHPHKTFVSALSHTVYQLFPFKWNCFN
jgi:hypothetical protein